MKERPILFNGDMVRAILDGRKTQTRRLMKPQPEPIPEDVWKDKRLPSERQFWWPSKKASQMVELRDMASIAPLGTVGDRLWVRETWAPHCEMPGAAIYRCDRGEDYQDTVTENFHWTPSIHMPRWASRVDLEITRVWVERVQDITEEDAKKEGVESVMFQNEQFWKAYGSNPIPGGGELTATRLAAQSFRTLWQSIYGNRPTLPKNQESKRYHRVKRWLDNNPPTGWDANPWVWAYEFRRIKP